MRQRRFLQKFASRSARGENKWDRGLACSSGKGWACLLRCSWALAVFETKFGADGATSREVYVVDGSGVRDYLLDTNDPVELALSGAPFLTFPLTVGTTTQMLDKTIDSGIDVDGDGRTDNVRIVVSATVVGAESITTPAGSFPGAAHLRNEGVFTFAPSRGGAALVTYARMDSWYAEGVGLVNSILRNWAPGLYDKTSTSQLAGYKVGLKTNDTTGPAVASTSPSAAATGAAPASVSVTLNEAIDPGSIRAGTFTVTDRDNVWIPGTVKVTGSTITFTSGQAWASGSYTAHLSTEVQDYLGNALAAGHDWSFTVDATGPRVLSMSPAEGSQDADVRAAVVLTWSEAVAPASINPDEVKTFDFKSDIAATISVNGNTITHPPTMPACWSAAPGRPGPGRWPGGHRQMPACQRPAPPHLRSPSGPQALPCPPGTRRPGRPKLLWPLAGLRWKPPLQVGWVQGLVPGPRPPGCSRRRRWRLPAAYLPAASTGQPATGTRQWLRPSARQLPRPWAGWPHCQSPECRGRGGRGRAGSWRCWVAPVAGRLCWATGPVPAARRSSATGTPSAPARV